LTTLAAPFVFTRNSSRVTLSSPLLAQTALKATGEPAIGVPVGVGVAVGFGVGEALGRGDGLGATLGLGLGLGLGVGSSQAVKLTTVNDAAKKRRGIFTRSLSP
jgi:hypothetical protein